MYDEGVLGGLKEGHDVLVQWVHVLHEPLVSGVVDLAGVVDDGEVGLVAELGLAELGVDGVRGVQLVDVGLVRGFREPALLVQQSQDAHWLWERKNKYVLSFYLHVYSAKKKKKKNIERSKID